LKCILVPTIGNASHFNIVHISMSRINIKHIHFKLLPEFQTFVKQLKTDLIINNNNKKQQMTPVRNKRSKKSLIIYHENGCSIFLWIFGNYQINCTASYSETIILSLQWHFHASTSNRKFIYEDSFWQYETLHCAVVFVSQNTKL
jgi:hypothetical protein